MTDYIELYKSGHKVSLIDSRLSVLSSHSYINHDILMLAMFHRIQELEDKVESHKNEVQSLEYQLESYRYECSEFDK